MNIRKLVPETHWEWVISENCGCIIECVFGNNFTLCSIVCKLYELILLQLIKVTTYTRAFEILGPNADNEALFSTWKVLHRMYFNSIFFAIFRRINNFLIFFICEQIKASIRKSNKISSVNTRLNSSVTKIITLFISPYLCMIFCCKINVEFWHFRILFIKFPNRKCKTYVQIICN